MEIRVNQTSNPKPKINPQPPKNENPQSLDQINPHPQTNNDLHQTNNDLQRMIEEVLNKYLTQQKQNNLSNNSNNTNDEFIIKSAMKASYVALRVEQLLTLKKKATLSALGFAVPIMLDSIMLVKKDLSKQLGINVNIGGIELFEMEVNDKGKNKKITGMRVVLSI